MSKPAAMNPIYLDHNATTATDPAVVAAMLPFFTENFANPSSGHQQGSVAAVALRQARRHIQSFIGAAREEEIVFTSGGSEADATALWQAIGREGRGEIIISAVEHAAILNGARRLEQMFGLKVHRIGVDRQGRLDRAAFTRALGPRTALVSVMWANNETGTLFPVAELAEKAHAAGALFHSDAVQAAGKIPLMLQDSGIDMISLSGHKFHGPKGIGVLYVRSPLRLVPLISGGKQERGRRAGTENLPAIVGLGAAAALTETRMAADTTAVTALRDHFEAELTNRIAGCHVLGDRANRLYNTASIAFTGAESEVILHDLDAAGIAASAGSACSSGMMEPSHVLRAMGLPFDWAQGVVRFSFGRSNSAEEVERLLALLPAIVAHARDVSPFTPPDTSPTAPRLTTAG
ncbi:MAG: aminotransferase class V-fold PLP-dependent enzyme [Rhizomicrobium sp.]